MGFEETSLQLLTSPPTGCIAASMSAAVVPGAKLLAITTYGPADDGFAMPRMLIEGPVGTLRMFAWLPDALGAESSRCRPSTMRLPRSKLVVEDGLDPRRPTS